MMEPLVSLGLRSAERVFAPGALLAGEMQVDAVDPRELKAVELSVLWYTEGKGDEDLGIHFFERRQAEGDGPPVLHTLHPFESTLPASPLSYDGTIVKVRWCVRVRLFFCQDREHVEDFPFRLAAAQGQLVEP